MTSEVDDPGYAVGRGKPPKHSQFAKGRSGNPKGRPKGSKNLATLFEEEGRIVVAVPDNGRIRKLTKNELLVKTVWSKGIKGDVRGFAVFRQSLKLDQAAAQPDAIEAADMLDDEAEQVMANWVARNKKDDFK